MSPLMFYLFYHSLLYKKEIDPVDDITDGNDKHVLSQIEQVILYKCMNNQKLFDTGSALILMIYCPIYTACVTNYIRFRGGMRGYINSFCVGTFYKLTMSFKYTLFGKDLWRGWNIQNVHMVHAPPIWTEHFTGKEGHFTILCLANDHWWGLNTRNAYIYVVHF